MGVADLGSSPRGRGKRGLHRAVSVSSGLIPAQAGKTTQGPGNVPGRAAHPRAGGENQTWVLPKGQERGSSPRRRGKRDGLTPTLARTWLIPAQAGKTTLDDLGTRGVQAHPRAGGENGCTRRRGWRTCGSSPRRRGKPNWRRRRPVGSGLIPAQAGKTSTNNHCPEVAGAHPRAGGENGI